ncbi:hypothetical protein ACLKA6_015388 [Drosophila palustris]
MARDRLPELLQRSLSANSTSSSSNGSLLLSVYNATTETLNNSNSNNNSHNNINSSNSNGDNNKDRDKMTQHGNNLDAILNPYSGIRYQLSQIAANLEAMSRMSQTINLRTFSENEMDELHNKNLRLGNQLMSRFKELKANLPPETDFSLEARMKRTLFYGLYQTYINLWQKNELFLQNYETKIKKNLRMHSKIINSEASEQEIELLIEKKTTKLFVDNILQETEMERQTLRDLMDRFNELKKLEKSIEDVHALFMRIQTLVMEQSETIQRVEFHANQATIYTDKGANELDEANEYAKKARKLVAGRSHCHWHKMEDNNSMCKNVKYAAEAVAVVAPESSTTYNGKGVHFKMATATAVATATGSTDEPEELLGSVTTQNCPGTRASARVIQKMKLDLTRPMTPPPAEREHSKKEEKAAQKTPSQMRAANRTTWTNVERNCFFDALNEFGKDFEAIANCINSKLKRRNTSSDHSFKSKDQVRQHYYQTYHKISKYVRFTDELKKLAQELYTLINYGEMRRKLQFLTEKHFMKLKQLIYQGHIIVRCKGKNIRIKTPSCKALRRLNQLDDTLEDIRLPSKIEVLVTPSNMEAFGRVQALAQNPRGRAIVPLHKKLFSFIKTFEYKWRSADARLSEEQMLPSGVTGVPETPDPPAEPSLCFLPKPGVPIHRPLLSITAHLSSVNICLTAYEERLGFKVRSETLESTAAAAAAIAKRARTESGSEKRSPEAKKLKTTCSPAHEKTLDELGDCGNPVKLENGSGDELSEEINELLSLTTGDGTVNSSSVSANPTTVAAQSTEAIVPPPLAAPPAPTPAPTRAKRNDALGAGGGKGAKGAARNFKPLLSDEAIKRIRKGWTVSSSADITIGDLYVVLGQDSKLELEYYWCDIELGTASSSTSASASTTSTTSLPYNTNDCDSAERVKAITTATVSNKLKHLLLVANLSERVRKRQCNCGHSCDRKRDLITKAQWLSSLANGTAGPRAAAAATSTDGNESIFRTPMLPIRRPITNIIDPMRQFSKLTRQKLSRHVLVQRCILPAASNASRPYDVLSLSNLQNGLFEPIDRVSSSNSNINQINSTLAMPVSSKTTSINNNNSGSSNESLQQPECSNVSDSGGMGSLDMPNLDFLEETSLPATTSTTLPEGAQDETTTQNFFNGSVSPMHLLRDSTSNSRWLEDNINDFSLTSLLGHLDDFDATRDILQDPSSSLSVISENSVDFRHKFQEISALLQQQEKD